MSLDIVVYSHTDYLDVLKIQTDYICKQNEESILFINKNFNNLYDIFSKYKKIIYYDDSKPYAQRLIECLNQIDSEYFLFTHDIDILLDYNKEKLIKLKDQMEKLNIDRIDLKYSNRINDGQHYISIEDNFNKFNISKKVPESEVFLIHQDNIRNHIYNVNPSLWKKNTFLNILNNYNYKTYRTIESDEVHDYCRRFNFYKIYSKNYLRCGYFECVDFYKYLHISHEGKFLSLNGKFVTEYNQSYYDIKEDWLKIILKYNLFNSEKWLKQ